MPKAILNLIGASRSRNERKCHRHAQRFIRDSGLAAIAYIQALFARLMVVNSGAAASEYTFLVALVSIVAVLGMILVGDDLQDYFQTLAVALDGASDPTPDPFAT